MMIEVCDLCKKPVGNLNKTKVIIRDYKGVHISDCGFTTPDERKFKGVICDDCLDKLRSSRDDD